MTLTMSVCHAWGNPTLTQRSAGPILAVQVSEKKATPPLAPSHFLPPRNLWEKNSRAEDLSGRWQESSGRLNARVPRRHRRGREHSPVLFTQHDQRPSAVRNMISFGASDGEIDDSLFFWWLRMRSCYRALWLTPPSYRHPLHVTPDSERMRSSSASLQRLSMSSGSNSLCWGAISEQVGRVFSLGALSSCFSCSHIRWWRWRKRIWAPASSGWVCGRTSLPAHSYWMEGEGEPSVQAMQSHICTRWMGLLGGWTSGFRIQPLSGTWGPGSTRHQSHRPSHRAFIVQPDSVGAPPLAHDDRDERGGHNSPPRRSGFIRQPVWTSCGGLCWTLHGGSEVVSGDATLPP